MLRLLIFLSGLFPALLSAQVTLTGTVVTTGGAPIEFATVAVGETSSGSILDAVTTDLEGRFELTTDATNPFLEITFLGFLDRRIENIELTGGRADLGNLELQEDAQLLDEVVVTGEQSTMEFKLDKRVFNVGKDLASTGAGALEVLNNVPSVNVTIEGQITLRGASGVQILINGKPSVLASEQGNALGTITANMIERVEVITNPSAKYEAEGTSGIINIVIKKDERRGVNGSVTVNTGVPHNHSLGLSINRRTERLNLFAQLGAGYRELPQDQLDINENLATGDRLRAEGEEFRNEQFYNLFLGGDYYLSPRSVFTLSGSFAYEIEDQPSTYLFEQTINRSLARWERTETTEATNPKYQFEARYRSDFDDSDEHYLQFGVLGNLFTKDQSSLFVEENIIGDEANDDQRTRTDFGEVRWTLSADYAKPINDNWTLETGALYVLSDVNNDFAVSNLENDVFVDDPNFTNVFEYRQSVLGGYATAAYERDAWGVKVGARVENTDLQTLLVTTNEPNAQNFTNLFPSAATSYKFTEAHSMQASYSRRIFRPRLWDLNPFFNIRNNFSIRTGNPDLLPEYTDSYELSSVHVRDKVSVNASIYYRRTTDRVERITRFEEQVAITTPLNIGTEDALGLELNGKYSPAKWWTLNGDVNVNRFDRRGELEGVTFDFTAARLFGKLRQQFKFAGDFDVEVTTHYQSPFETVQGRVSGQAFADLGLRKKLGKGKTILNLSVRDVFASRVREFENFRGDFRQYGRGLRGRFVTLGVSYGFGKGEAMEFSGRKRI